jgi:hypothetical protein
MVMVASFRRHSDLVGDAPNVDGTWTIFKRWIIMAHRLTSGYYFLGFFPDIRDTLIN